MNKPNVLFVIGPTASGKTGLSIELAKKFNGEVISCDSMQIYRKMDIGTAKPTSDERSGIKHYLIDICDIKDTFSVNDYQKLANNKIQEISKMSKLPIVVGGTGLYVDSLLNNTEFAEHNSSEKTREELNFQLEKFGKEYLFNKLLEVDPITAEKLHLNDTKRIIRALECYILTGIPKSEHDKNSHKREVPFNPLIIGLNYTDRDILYERINKRVDILIENGLICEIKSLINEGLKETQTASQAIGYKEFYDYVDGKEEIDIAIERLKQETRRYAKRQLTWFRRNKDIKWINVDTDADCNFEKLTQIAEGIINENFGVI